MSKKLINLSKDIKDMCEPFFKKFGLDHFNYIHRDDHQQVTYLCSNPKWLNHYINNSYPRIGFFEQNPDLTNLKYILWNGLNRDDPILIDSKEMIGVEFGITIIKKEKDGWGYYNLGKKTSCQSIINNYINNLPNYEKFIAYFQDRASSTLETAKKLKFSIRNAIPIINQKKLGKQFGEFYLTNRELNCIKYLSIGKTAEEIAIILNISKRTVETHIHHIKRKFNCYNQFSLGYLIGKTGIK